MAKDGENSWDYRKGFCIEVLREMSADALCFQEARCEQFEDLQPGLPEYDCIRMNDAPCGQHPLNAIFFRREGFRVVSSGGYWLSEKPHVAGTKSWDSACVRFANWLRLEEISSGQEFRLINTHLDHRGQTAREKQAEILAEDTVAYPEEYPQILTGDMNCDVSNKAIDIFKNAGWKDTYEIAHGEPEPGLTYHGYQGDAFASKVGKIDFIFVRGQATVTGSEIVKTSRDGKFPSDHYFITADFQLAPQT